MIDHEEKLSVAELKAFLFRNFAKYQRPDDYVFIEEVPKTSVGKFDKKEIRKRYAEGKFT